MDFYYTVADPLVISVSFLSSLLFGLFLGRFLKTFLRKVIPKKVKCWFCHNETIISYKFANRWVCDNCEQYNGFNKDGDYNRVIPNQHEPKLNSRGFTYQFNQKSYKTKNTLCEKCNFKQQFKIQQLAEFVPMNEKNYDKEIEHFQRQIDKGFKICSKCDSLLAKVLCTLRDDLSLPKKLSAAVSKINIRGERAILISVLLSFLLALSPMELELSLPLELTEGINQSLYSNEIIRGYFSIVSNHSMTSLILRNALQILIGTGICANSLGFYQTNSPPVFYNVILWIIMFFLTIYPYGIDSSINILKVLVGGASMAIGITFLINNYNRKNKRKSSLWEKRNTYTASSTPISPLQTRSQSVSNITTVLDSRLPSDVEKRYKDSPKHENSPFGIRSGMSNLSLGLRKRGDLARPPLVNPAKFNPFNRSSPSERSYLTGKGLDDSCHSRPIPSERNYHSSLQTSGKGYDLSQSRISSSERSYLTSQPGKGYDDPCHSRASPLERNYQTLSHPGIFPTEGSYLHDGRVSPLDKSFYSKFGVGDVGKYYTASPSVFDGFGQLPSYSYTQPCYPCSPTLAYYFSTQQFPKVSPPSPILLSSTPNSTYLDKNETSYGTILWKFFPIISVVLVVLNIILMSVLYLRGT